MAPPLFSQRGNVMYYAALGDISGIPHEFNDQNTTDPDYEFIVEKYVNKRFTPETNPNYNKSYKNKCSDDTILSMAVAKSIVEVGDNLDKLEETTAKNLKAFVRLYPNGTVPGSYGPSFVNWAKTDGFESMTGRPSFGNGSAMRVSAVGWAYNSLEKTLKAAEKTALPSHRHPEAIKGAQAIASAIYLARAGVKKEDIKAFLETKFDYDLDIPYKDYQKYNQNELKQQSEFCQTTVPMAICAFLNSTDKGPRSGYEDCVRKAVNICGDSDTIGAMAGSIAGAYYGMAKEHETKCGSMLNDHLNGVANEFQQFVAARHTEPDKAELEAVLAKARLESYLLQQAKSNSPFTPEKANEVLDLLAKSEAARLFHEQVKAARQKNDKDLEKSLLDNQKDIVDALEQKCKESPELLEKWQAMKSWPVKQVKVVDVDEMVGRRKPGLPKTLPQQRAVVDHQAVAKLSMTKCGVVDEVLAEKIGKIPEMPVKPKRAFLLARPFLSLYHMIKGDYKPFSQKMTEYNEDLQRIGKINSLLERRHAAENGYITENTEKTVTAEKEESTAVEDQKPEKLRTLKQKTETQERNDNIAVHNIDPVLIRQVHNVKQTLESKSLESSCKIQTYMRDDAYYAPIQHFGPVFFIQKVENYLNQVLNEKAQPNADFMETLADPKKFDEVYDKWADSNDGRELGLKLRDKYFHDYQLREDMEANPAIKSKLDENAKIEDDKEFVEKLVKEGFNVHRQFLNATLNAASDSEMKKILTDFSFIKEFKSSEIQAEQSTTQPNAEPTQPNAESVASDATVQSDVTTSAESTVSV